MLSSLFLFVTKSIQFIIYLETKEINEESEQKLIKSVGDFPRSAKSSTENPHPLLFFINLKNRSTV